MGEKHTPGPWIAHHQPLELMGGENSCDWSLQTKDEAFLLFCHRPSAPAEANARLIAAAPEMLDLLKAMNDAADAIGEQPIMAWAGAIKNILAKAMEE